MNFFKFIEKLEGKLETGEIKDGETCICDMLFSGAVYAGNEKKSAKATILLPKEICHTNLKDLNQWDIKIFAVKREAFNKILKEDEAEA